MTHPILFAPEGTLVTNTRPAGFILIEIAIGRGYPRVQRMGDTTWIIAEEGVICNPAQVPSGCVLIEHKAGTPSPMLTGGEPCTF